MPIGVFPDFFQLREATMSRPRETYLSAVYFEISGLNDQKRWSGCAANLFKLANGEAYVRLNAGLIRAQGAKRDTRLRVTHEPKKAVANYAAIRGINFTPDNQLNELLAALAVVEIVDRIVVEPKP
jgi:hypothetical protein